MQTRPLIGITMGDPAGIGPELCLRLLCDRTLLRRCTPVIFGDADILARVARAVGLPLPWRAMSLNDWTKVPSAERVVVNCGAMTGKTVRPGVVQAACGQAAYAYVEAAVQAAVAGRVRAIATAPINKTSLHKAGIPYPGHTEILAKLTGTRRYCMMLASDKLAVSLATIHVGYAEVPPLLTVSGLVDVIELTAAAMRRLGKRNPRIAVCALNPHAGENGAFGTEETAVIVPTIERAHASGLRVEGPLPPDTAFLPARRRKTDAYVAMYHDQGLIPFKMLAFDKGVNVTLGLPIVRTSPNHGTAFDIAWKGKASASSMIQSVLWAMKLAKR